MKKGKMTSVETACLKGMLSGDVSNEDMAKQLGRSVAVIQKEVDRLTEEAAREALHVKSTARGDSGVVAMTEVASMSDARNSATPATDHKNSSSVHTIYDG
jgi:tRNA U38,U39,U40 pseudouridine synthase TruA